MKKALLVFVWAILLSAMGLLVLVFYWSFYPFHIIDYELPFQVLNENKEVAKGGDLHFLIKYDKHLQVNGVGTSAILCGDGNLVTVLPPRSTGSSFPLGKHELQVDMIIQRRLHWEFVILKV